MNQMSLSEGNNDDNKIPNQSSIVRVSGSELRKAKSKKKTLSLIVQASAARGYRVEYGEANPKLSLNKKYGDNKITTTKYNILTFCPKSLFLQFKRAANIYFLVVSILTCLKFSPKQPSSMIGTFAFVLLCTMVKDAIEDYGRYKQDSLSNNRMVLRYSTGNWQKVKCHKLRPGDMIKVVQEEEFSCDTLLIKSSNEGGYCHIDTKNLDGETNLKEKCALEEFNDCMNNDVSFKKMLGNIRTTDPDPNLLDWEGIVTYNEMSDIYCLLANLALKGSVLKNTEYVIGIVVFAGHNTKIMRNSKHPKHKMSKIMRTMNRLLYSLFAFDIIICIIFGCLSFVFVRTYGEKYSYIFPGYDPDAITNLAGVRFGFTFLTFFIAYSQLIPISLYVTMEIVKLIQGILIFYDSDIYDCDLKKPATCRTTDLVEELGQVDFVFSDKTGTLTQNNMVFKKCYVNKKIYGADGTEKEDMKGSINGEMTALAKLTYEPTSEEDMKDREMLDIFFLLLALCHSVFPQMTDAGIKYQGSSPDDIALVKGAAQLGYIFQSKKYNDIFIENQFTKTRLTYEMLAALPFSSDRKRMSVLVTESVTERKILFSKGADVVMLNGVSGKPALITQFNSTEELADSKTILDAFSKEGLRCLVMGYKIVDNNFYDKWIKRHNEARTISQEKLNSVYDEIEKDLTFVGCSAIEDKLQDGVPDTIHTLLQCGIRVWVLTGDKQDTAEQIARQCRLIEKDMALLNLSLANPSEIAIKELLETFLFDFNLFRFQEENELNLEDINQAMKKGGEIDPMSIIIDGVTLEKIISVPELAKEFFLLSVFAKSVICCRVSPKQKSDVVRLAKTYGEWVTLAIGDGANDVPMIMEASIGVGIQGKEGTQAMRSADYAIGQFRFLEKLLLYYGRNGYIKISKFICYYFYKNIILVVTELFFAFYDGFSGQIYFAEYLGTMFNAFFTSWPCIFTFSLEKEHDVTLCKAFPVLYRAGPKNYYFNFKVFWTYIIYAFVHSALAFFIPCCGIIGITGSDGVFYDHWRISTISFCLVIHIVTIKLLVISDFWNILNIIATIASVAFYYLVLIFLCTDTFGKMFQNELVGVAQDILLKFNSLCVLIIGSCIILLPDIICKQIFFFLFPTPSQLIARNKSSLELVKIMNEGPIPKKRISSRLNTVKSECSKICQKIPSDVNEISVCPLKGPSGPLFSIPDNHINTSQNQPVPYKRQVKVSDKAVSRTGLSHCGQMDYQEESNQQDKPIIKKLLETAQMKRELRLKNKCFTEIPTQIEDYKIEIPEDPTMIIPEMKEDSAIQDPNFIDNNHIH